MKRYLLLSLLALPGCVVDDNESLDGTDATASPSIDGDIQPDAEVQTHDWGVDERDLGHMHDAAVVVDGGEGTDGEIDVDGEILEDAGPATDATTTDAGAVDECPRAVVFMDDLVVHPLDVVVLDASPSTDANGPNGRPVSYQWTVISRPEGSTAQPVEAFFNPLTPQAGGPADDTDTPTAQFFVDLAGEYTIAAVVTGADGLSAPSDRCPQADAIVHIDARPQGAIHIQLVWDTPNDADQTDNDGTDMDLHLLRPGADRYAWLGPDDCYYANSQPDWGASGMENNPSLDIDDVSGAGPENININDPEDTGPATSGYRVGVDYYSDRQMGESTATVRVYLSGVLAGEWSRLMATTHHFWEAAEIIWAPDDHRTEGLDNYYTCVPDIIMCPIDEPAP